ncbi:MAG: radical SAM family heme chaperone HemW [Gammaproteobacteria bacterium]
MSFLPPLSLYIHFPWCIQKCPYCDFNSHTLKQDLPETLYIRALQQELNIHRPLLAQRPIISVFMGGGTPSLFSGKAIQTLMDTLQNLLAPYCEVTLEANPGTVEQQHFQQYHEAGVNRISLGVQSFQPHCLKSLGRIHNDIEACRAIETAQTAGFQHINIDLMHGLPQQTWKEAQADLMTALSFHPTHLSWYQLTLEPNTPFYQTPPTLPDETTLHNIQMQGHQLLIQHGFHHYEVSAYSTPQHHCIHNTNYWTFGDYLGIGAGAHSKITHKNGLIERFWNVKHPKQYLNNNTPTIGEKKILTAKEVPFEFMLNALRLQRPIAYKLFTERTGLSIATIQKTLDQLEEEHCLIQNVDTFSLTALGHRFLDNVVARFLP